MIGTLLGEQLKPLKKMYHLGPLDALILLVDSFFFLEIFSCIDHLDLFHSIHADKLSDGVIQSIVDLLYKELEVLIQHISRVTSPGVTTDLRESSKEAQFTAEQEGRATQTALCNFLIFLRTVAITRAVQSKMATNPWVHLLLSLVADGGVAFSLRVKMLTLLLLEIILPACNPVTDKQLMTSVRICTNVMTM